jgi:protein-S-isoprenylcysteine O-methyltransferase Ste14
MRTFWIVFGMAAHALFALTVCRLFPFLEGEGWYTGVFSARAAALGAGAGLNAVLAVQFAVVHSTFLLPATRRRLERWVPSAQYGCFFCLVTCLSLLLAIEGWQPSLPALWRLHGVARGVVFGGFLASWAGLFYSLHLTGLGYQTGWTPWWAWARRRPAPRRRFEPRGAYRVLRHPIYLSFLGLVWFTPAMTADRAVLTGIWTVYIFVGSCLKDRRLEHYVGDPYRRYQAEVAGYPFMPAGPLARRPLAAAAPAGAARAG